MCSETSEAVGTIWEHAQKGISEIFENKNRPSVLPRKRTICGALWIPDGRYQTLSGNLIPRFQMQPRAKLA